MGTTAFEACRFGVRACGEGEGRSEFNIDSRDMSTPAYYGIARRGAERRRRRRCVRRAFTRARSRTSFVSISSSPQGVSESSSDHSSGEFLRIPCPPETRACARRSSAPAPKIVAPTRAVPRAALGEDLVNRPRRPRVSILAGAAPPPAASPAPSTVSCLARVRPTVARTALPPPVRCCHATNICQIKTPQQRSTLDEPFDGSLDIPPVAHREPSFPSCCPTREPR